jgi:uncharacterized YccA/Bax inhibitor family protein
MLSRIGAASQQPRYVIPGQGAPTDYSTGAGYPGVIQGPRDVMTIDDVVVKTVGLLGLTTLFAAIAFFFVPLELIRPVWIASAVLGLIVGLVIQFGQVTNPIVIGLYALLEGAFVGAISKAYNYVYDGVVIQAIAATLGVFFLMAALYKSKIIRATPKFMKVVIGITGGLMIVMLINLGIFLFTGAPSPLRDGSPIAIMFSVVCIIVAALMFVVNFKQIEDGVAAGLPRRFGWLAAVGLLVELIWMYLEFLRLLSYLQGDD